MDTSETCGHDVHRCKSRDAIGENYGMTGRNIARYIRLNQTIGQIKDMVDSGGMTLVVAVELSYLIKEEQEMVCVAVFEQGIKKLLHGLLYLPMVDDGKKTFYCIGYFFEV